MVAGTCIDRFWSESKRRGESQESECRKNQLSEHFWKLLMFWCCLDLDEIEPLVPRLTLTLGTVGRTIDAWGMCLLPFFSSHLVVGGWIFGSNTRNSHA